MKGLDLIDPREKFKFLDEKTSNEPHIYEVLNEILLYQMNSLPSGERPLATMDVLKKSGKIKIPFTTTRDRTIEYLADILLRRYPHFIRPIISFDFHVEPSTKQIDILETTEYTILLDNKDFEVLLSIRDKKSTDNLIELLKKYRFFNLSKLIKKADEKEELSRIIKKQLDINIFTFKNYNIDSNKIEWAEDFCFHVDNYEHVKESLNLNSLKEIISAYSDSVKKGLNKFGILNSEFSDYRDTKLAYIFSILTDDLSTTLSEKDLVDVKNLQSLISCLNRVDKVIDPVLTVNEDIVKLIREHKITTETEIKATLTELDSGILSKWAGRENLKTNKVLAFKSNEGEMYYIDGLTFFEMISELNQLILFQTEKMSELSNNERRKANTRMDILYGASMNVFKSSEKIEDYIKINSEKLQILTKILEDYYKYKNKAKSAENLASAPGPVKKKENIFKVIIKAFFGFFVSLFKFYAKGDAQEDSDEIGDYGTAAAKRKLSHETSKIYNKTININAPVIPLSDFIELIPENDYLINRIIKDMREHNLKIVVPIYNARKNLYPKRSQKLLMSDMEYLLISPERAKQPETIRAFTDSLVGQKLKDEIMPSSAIIAIEKYLLTLYRQRKAFK
ncbi:MAG: hypothetical protein JXN64_11030 [Spirochaetes bacterium]|nr:hypothetical protein [Spirochaetota bacterium]